MFGLVLFVLGASAGSFLNVVALRYDPDAFIFNKKVIGGRSHCPQCHKTLRWYELIPLLSFLLQRRRCRGCGVPLSWQYPLAELIGGFLVWAIPQGLGAHYLPIPREVPFLAFLWVLAFLTLLLITLIDIRLQLIPDEATLFLGIVGLLIAYKGALAFGIASGSFAGAYSVLFGIRDALWINRIFAMFIGFAIFGFLILITRGRGMGVGDLKLAVALGILFGWPDILLIIIFAFITGSLVGLSAILLRRKMMKSYLPFGPFLALGAAFVFFYGEAILKHYFGLAAL